MVGSSPRVPGPAGTAGRPGVFEASAESPDRTEERHETAHCANDRGPTLGQTGGQCGGVFALGRGVGKESERASTFQGPCKLVPLPGIRDALRSEAAIPVLREQAKAGSCWLHAVFEPGLADEASGSMDRLGRCDTWASLEKTLEEVIEKVFEEAAYRDPLGIRRSG